MAGLSSYASPCGSFTQPVRGLTLSDIRDSIKFLLFGRVGVQMFH